MSKTYIYLDNAATTLMDKDVVDLMYETHKTVFGNPSSIHGIGRQAKTIVEKSRKTIAKILNASIGEIFFTSGGTESNNMVLASMPKLGITRLITTKGEHPSVLNYIENNNINVEFVKVDHHGRVVTKELDQLLKSSNEKSLVSIIHGHNELGTINDLKTIGQICKDNNALFHSDTVQSIGHVAIDVQEINIDFLTSSGHKYHGPRGVGFIYVNNDNLIDPYLWGGAQERNLRAGTEDTASIAGIALALDIQHKDLYNKEAHLNDMKQYFISQLNTIGLDILFNGDIEHNHLGHILNVSFPLTDKTDLLVMSMDMNGICVSGGSACSSGVEHSSPILNAIKMPTNRKAIRFSFSKHTNRDEIDYCIKCLTKILQK